MVNINKQTLFTTVKKNELHVKFEISLRMRNEEVYPLILFTDLFNFGAKTPLKQYSVFMPIFSHLTSTFVFICTVHFLIEFSYERMIKNFTLRSGRPHDCFALLMIIAKVVASI